MDNIKEAFLKVRKEILELKKDRDLLESGVVENRKRLYEICNMLTDLTVKLQIIQRNNDFNIKRENVQNIQALNSLNTQNTHPTIQNTHPTGSPNNKNTQDNKDLSDNPLIIPNISTYSLNKVFLDRQTKEKEISTHFRYSSTYNLPLEGLNSQNLGISKGNGGVQTDRQTNQQTDNIKEKAQNIDRQTNQQTDNIKEKAQNIEKSTVDSAIDILSSLDSVRKRLRLDFKGLTDQEWLVFSTIYTLEEEQGYADYRLIASKLKLTESSIRDYIGRLIKKGIPVDKNKINNKNIRLSISKNLKKIAPLSQILELRELY